MSEPQDASQNNKVPLDARLPTATEIALLEYGKQVLLKSTETALDFHKTMLGVSATFGTLITTLTPILVWGDKDAKIPKSDGWLLIIPPFLMLLSAVVFAWGYLPRYAQFNPSIVEQVKEVRERTLRSRRLLAGVGLFLFCLSILTLIGLVLWLRY